MLSNARDSVGDDEDDVEHDDEDGDGGGGRRDELREGGGEKSGDRVAPIRQLAGQGHTSGHFHLSCHAMSLLPAPMPLPGHSSVTDVTQCRRLPQ